MSISSIMLVAGEPSGDLLAAELVRALSAEWKTKPRGPSGPRFFGGGGPQMRAAGVELALDLTQHAVVGLAEVIRNYGKFRRIFKQLLGLALHRRPDVIVCVDFSGFNRRFARQIRWEIQVRGLQDWRPRIVQYVSPQVWASRPGRAKAMARDFDLVLAIFPFEKPWYAERVPKLRVEFVGHPMLDRHAKTQAPEARAAGESAPAPDQGLVVLLPGSRVDELQRHLPVMLEAWKRIVSAAPGARGVLVLPNEALAGLAKTTCASCGLPQFTIQVGRLADALSAASLAMAATGTVTMECAYFRVPTVALYKTSWSTYQIGKRIIQVRYLAMPNLLAQEALFPEFIQDQATPDNLAQAALNLWNDPGRRQVIRDKLAALVASLGGPGASVRAARAILAG